jgi:DNA-binding response OmpR family regulator
MVHLSGCSAVSCHLTVYTKFRTPSILLKNLNNNTPVILMSGSLLVQEETALELGAAAFMSKPFRLNELLRQIEVCIAG